MWRKLLLYMLALVLVVGVFVSCGLFFAGQFSTTTEKYSDNLTFQNEFYTRQIEKYFDDISMMGEMLAADSSAIIDAYLSENGISFNALNDSLSHTEGMQKALLPKLREELLKADASGAFIVMDATVNSGATNADKSRTGLYFQRSTLDRTDETLLMYRGNSDLGRQNGIMPHRKWRLEFNTESVAEIKDIFGKSVKDKRPLLSDVYALDGTSDSAMAYITPIFGADNTFYGICGFEISNTYFKDYFAQPTRLDQLTCTFSKTSKDSKIDCENIFWTGVLGGYSLKPSGTLSPKIIKNNLTELSGETNFVAVTKTISICDTAYSLVVMQPKSGFDKTIAVNATRIVLVCFLLVFAAVVLSVVFSRKFVAPVIKNLEQIRKQEHAENNSDIIEIDDLFVYLAEQDKRQNEELASVTENQTAEIDKRQAEIERLAYSRKNEIDPDNYEAFKAGLKELTKTERKIFDLYIDGKSANEIADVLNIRESTLKFHNHNILEKLGVSSRKHMLRYATLLRQETQEQ